MKDKHISFVAPLTEEDAMQRLVELQYEIKNIEIKLSDNNKTNIDGTRMSFEEWNSWRHKALFAKLKITQEYQMVKNWLYKFNHRQIKAEILDGDETTSLIYSLWSLCRNLMLGEEKKEEYWKIIGLARDYLISKSIIK